MGGRGRDRKGRGRRKKRSRRRKHIFIQGGRREGGVKRKGGDGR